VCRPFEIRTANSRRGVLKEEEKKKEKEKKEKVSVRARNNCSLIRGRSSPRRM